MSLTPVIANFDPLFVKHFACTPGVACHEGDFLVLQSGYATLMTSESSANFLGVAGGVESNDTIPVYMRCLLKVNLDENAYSFGDGLKYHSRETLTHDLGDATVAHYFGDPNIFSPTDNISWGHVFIDLLELKNSNWDVISA